MNCSNMKSIRVCCNWRTELMECHIEVYNKLCKVFKTYYLLLLFIIFFMYCSGWALYKLLGGVFCNFLEGCFVLQIILFHLILQIFEYLDFRNSFNLLKNLSALVSLEKGGWLCYCLFDSASILNWLFWNAYLTLIR